MASLSKKSPEPSSPQPAIYRVDTSKERDCWGADTGPGELCCAGSARHHEPCVMRASETSGRRRTNAQSLRRGRETSSPGVASTTFIRWGDPASSCDTTFAERRAVSEACRCHGWLRSQGWMEKVEEWTGRRHSKPARWSQSCVGLRPMRSWQRPEALVAQRFALIEVSLNSPSALDSIQIASRTFRDGAILGGGTVPRAKAVQACTKRGAG